MKKVKTQKKGVIKLKIKKGDTVYILSGKDKGKVGKVLAVYPKKERVIVEGINVVKKHRKLDPNQKGQIIETEAPIHISKVAILDPKLKVPTRVGRKLVDGRWVRYCKKSGTVLD